MLTYNNFLLSTTEMITTVVKQLYVIMTPPKLLHSNIKSKASNVTSVYFDRNSQRFTQKFKKLEGKSPLQSFYTAQGLSTEVSNCRFQLLTLKCSQD